MHGIPEHKVITAQEVKRCRRLSMCAKLHPAAESPVELVKGERSTLNDALAIRVKRCVKFVARDSGLCGVLTL